MKVNICGRRYHNVYGNWRSMYLNVIEAFEELDADISVSSVLNFDAPEHLSRKITDSEDAVYVYNHTTRNDILENNFYFGKKTSFIKPTSPTPNHFSIDSLGYACTSSITYDEPNYKNVDSTEFFKNVVVEYKTSRMTKWQDRSEFDFIYEDDYEIPDKHVLVIGQMPEDETVRNFSFGNHWDKLRSIVNQLWRSNQKVVVKVHPHLINEAKDWNFYLDTIKDWQAHGITVLYNKESLYDILPKTKVAILENSTSGIECMMHDVPMITHGYPEYHWVSKDLRHLNMLNDYIEDLSWFNKEQSRQWLTWYCTQYLCYDKDSTLKRIKEIINGK